MTRTLFMFGFGCLFTAAAQQPVVVLDPARGGTDSGARIADRLPEKQVTLDIAGRLASLLRARGFTVVMTRDADTDVTNDERAALANNARAIACILLHATGAGSGVHLYTSAMVGLPIMSGTPVRWDEAQAPFVDRSHALEGDIQAALKHSRIDASSGQTWMRPLDNMQCPAVAVEIAPEKNGTGAENSTYQAQVSNALANTLLQWRGKVSSMVPPPEQPAPAAGAAKPVAAARDASTLPEKPAPNPAATASSAPKTASGSQGTTRTVPKAPTALKAAPAAQTPAPNADRTEP